MRRMLRTAARLLAFRNVCILDIGIFWLFFRVRVLCSLNIALVHKIVAGVGTGGGEGIRSKLGPCTKFKVSSWLIFSSRQRLRPEGLNVKGKKAGGSISSACTDFPKLRAIIGACARHVRLV